jgi:hypothetical protein
MASKCSNKMHSWAMMRFGEYLLPVERFGEKSPENEEFTGN